MNHEERKKSIQFSYKYVLFNALSIGFGERYFEAFAAFLQASPFQFSLLVSLPQFIGSFFQLFTFRLLQWVKSRKKLHLFFATVQTSIWLGLVIIAWGHFSYGFWFSLLLLVIYVTAGAFINPLWNSWILDLLDDQQRGQFFGKSHVIVNAIGLFAFIVGGSLLSFTHHSLLGDWLGFLLLFFMAFLGNALAVFYLKKNQEPPLILVKPTITLHRFFLGLQKQEQGKISLYLLSMTFAIYLSAPFFTPYLLHTLHFSYLQYAFLMGLLYVPKIFFGKNIGSVVDTFGPKKMVQLGSLFIAITPFFWLIIKSFWLFCLVQLYAGLAYSIYEISALSFFLNATNQANRISLFSYHTFLNGIMILIGSLTSNLTLSLPFFSGFLNAFFLSGILRFLIFFTLFPRFQEKPHYRTATYQQLTKEIIGIYGFSFLSQKFIAAKDLISVRVAERKMFIKKSYPLKIITPQKRSRKEIKGDKTKNTSSYVIYMCKQCNAEFKRRKSTKTPLQCPYCGGNDLLFLRG